MILLKKDAPLFGAAKAETRRKNINKPTKIKTGSEKILFGCTSKDCGDVHLKHTQMYIKPKFTYCP
jgi:hypothetical protein